jgi:hypothetical protein
MSSEATGKLTVTWAPLGSTGIAEPVGVGVGVGVADADAVAAGTGSRVTT